jgi:hypothetical protein
MTVQPKNDNESNGLTGSIMAWVVGLGIFAFIVWAALMMIQE